MKVYMLLIFMCLGSFLLLWPKDEGYDIDMFFIQQPDYFEVTIDGYVCFPGTYRFFEPISMNDLIAKAGGYTHPDVISQPGYQIISQNRHIQISLKETDEQPIILRVNVNQATFKQLIEIPYMTETRAASLIIYREANGPFTHIDQLIHVKHIGAVTLENLRPYITV